MQLKFLSAPWPRAEALKLFLRKLHPILHLNHAPAMPLRHLANRWEQVEQALGRERMVELFGHIRMIYERDKPRFDCAAFSEVPH